jgi:hypothetical protein
MKNKKKVPVVSTVLKRKKKSQKGGINPTYGPFAASNSHLFNEEDKAKARAVIEKNKANLAEELAYDDNERSNEDERLKEQKSRDIEAENALKQRRHENANQQRSMQAQGVSSASALMSGFIGTAVATIIGVAQYLITLISDNLQYWIGLFVQKLQDFLWAAGHVMAFLWDKIVEAFKIILSMFDGVFNGLALHPFLDLICGIIFFIIVLIIIILIIVYIFIGISSAIGSLMPGGGEGSESSVSTACKNVTEITLANFGGFFSGLQVGNLYNPLDKITFSKPEFPSMPSIPQFRFTNPFASAIEYAYYLTNLFVNSDQVNSIASRVTYGYNFASETVAFMSGVPTSGLMRRSLLPHGRLNNNDFIDISLIDNASLLKDRKIANANSAVILTRPADIVWEIPDLEYKYKDLANIPPSMLDMKNDGDISLNDKREIIIPWIVKDNFYKLSCKDAYFKNDINQKANVLIDNEDGKTCSFNIDSKSEEYSENAKRYTYTNDLSSYL